MRRLETTTDLLDALQERYGWTSDNQIAIGLKIPPQTVSSWRTGRTSPTEVHAITIAAALSMNPLHVLAIAAAERDKKNRAVWLAHIAQGVLVGLFTIGAAPTAYSPPAQAQVAPDVYSGKSRKRRAADPLAA